ncbi:MAG: hypothetical protein U9Q81_13700 [Pseudomonadota bacterium]|nr:hypothetical protein [Pseudomonadota bacterium]
MKTIFLFLLLVVTCPLPAADVSEIEMRRLFEPTDNELAVERAGRIYIYEGLRTTDIARAMDEEFDRVESMMFIRTKVVDETGEAAKDARTGEDLVEDDGC